MNIKDFLQQASTGLLPKSPVLLFVGRPLSPLLLGRFAPLLVKQFMLQESAVLVASQDSVQQVLAQLHLSFLGAELFYWLGSFTEFDAPTREALAALIPTYTGPHVIGLSIEADEVKKLGRGGMKGVLQVEVPERLDDPDVLPLLASVLGYAVPEGKSVRRLAAQLDLSQVSVLLAYGALAGAEMETVCSSWAQRIFEPEQSLFELSKVFFGKDIVAFLAQWKVVQQQYAPEFWIVFWAEQFWQAWLVVRSMKKQGTAPERKFINRLPFSFTQRDWKKYQERELVAAHNALYQVDFALKNGGAAGALEAVLLRFITGGFARV